MTFNTKFIPIAQASDDLNTVVLKGSKFGI